MKAPSLAVALVALAAFAAAAGVLDWAAQPARAGPRIAALERKLHATRGEPSSSDAAAICTERPSRIEATYPGVLDRAVAAAGVTLGESSIVEAFGAEGPAPHVDVSFTASGSQDSALALLQALARERPALWVRNLSFRPRGEGVELTLEGAIWCAP